MHAGHFTLVIIKPDAIEQNLVGVIRSELASSGLKVKSLGCIQFNLDFVQSFNQWSQIDYPDAIKGYLCNEPLDVWLVEGQEAACVTLEVKKRLRAKYCIGRLKTLFHSSSSQTDFVWELSQIKTRMKTMKTNNQVEVIVFKHPSPGITMFLMLKRNFQKGGFWQPVTGNVEIGETFEDAAVREVKEEIGIQELTKLIDTGYVFEFVDDDRTQKEKVFGGLVSNDQIVTLSSEHTEFKWATFDQALNIFLKYPGNKEGLRRLQQMLLKT
jgi:dihydroneopterin triphosphate diphosphatase